MSLLFWIALASIIFYAASLVDMIIGGRQIMAVADEAPWPADGSVGDDAPLLSVVIPARNEARNLAAALRSVLAQDYPQIEFMLINDRSTDATGAIMREIAAHDPRVQVVDVTDLPAGWLGKNHAMALGAGQSHGKLILFADADIVMEPSVFRRAVAHLLRRDVDNVTIAPGFLKAGGVLHAFLGSFVFFFSFFATPWRARRPRSKAFIGIGAFNMMKRSIYEKVGTHKTIAMRPDDDIKLGKIIKRAGFRQEVMHGGGMVQVEWYATLREMIHGLMKNAFAGVDYNLGVVLAGIIGILIGIVWPFVALFVTHGLVFWMNLVCVALLMTFYILVVRQTCLKKRHAVLLPAGALLMIYILARATFLTYWNDGISWRGTHYSLAELRANKV